MNTRPPIEAPNEPVVLSVSFNNDSSRFAVGLDSGFGIFQSSTCELQASKDFGGGLGLVQMMGNANYLALAGGGRSPKFPSNKVIIWDDSKGKVALEISTLTSVRGVQLSKTRVVVVLHNSGTLIRIFSTNSGAKIAERRRGAEAATVYSMRFSPSALGALRPQLYNPIRPVQELLEAAATLLRTPRTNGPKAYSSNSAVYTGPGGHSALTL
ncbi:hypothetical protein DL770_005142 [Monosporascus sp. CRB-9-2]|nr:hypothetical protein DL770_005142 [Monosporascus sp. CRB-9-2]